MLGLKNCALSSPSGESMSANDYPWVCATVPTSYKKICLNFFSFRHHTCLHWWTFACHKRILDKTYYFTLRDVCPPPEGWAQCQRRKVMLRRPQIWIIGLSCHSWRYYTHTKESRCHSSPCSPKDSETIVSVHQYDQLLSWNVEKEL